MLFACKLFEIRLDINHTRVQFDYIFIEWTVYEHDKIMIDYLYKYKLKYLHIYYFIE